MEQNKIDTLTNEQLDIKDKLENWIYDKTTTEKYKCLTGKAGTGKTYLITCLDLPVDTIFVAPTHQASSVISSQTNFSCVSYDSFTYSTPQIEKDKLVFKSDKKKWKFAKNYDLIIVDEASMFSKAMIEILTTIYKKSKILFVGDKGQLPPIDKDDYSVFDVYECYDLTENIRSGLNNPLISLAEKYYLTTNLEIPTKSKCTDKGYKLINYTDLTSLFKNNQLDTVCVATNKLKDLINRDMHNKLYPNVTYGIGEKLIANDNIGYNPNTNPKYKITNSTIMTVLDYKSVLGKVVVDNYTDLFIEVMWEEITTDIHNHIVRVLNPMYIQEYDKFLKSIHKLCDLNTLDWDTYHKYKNYFSDISYAYAITIHKSQGSTYNNIAIACQDIKNFFDKSAIRTKLMYTAITRAKKICYLII